jgi:hypothetical protein
VAVDDAQHAIVSASTTFMARNGDAISVTLQVESSVGVGDDRFDYGDGGAHMAAKASIQATLTGVSVFNFSEPGWTANTVDGSIVDNRLAAPPPRGDFDLDGTVDGHDFLKWQRTLGQLVDRSTEADGNGNGYIDFDDLNDWRGHFSQSAASPGAAVPEPGAIWLAGFAACLLAPHASRRLTRIS